MMPYTSRDRVRAFLARSHADRVPINYMANSGIDRRLKQHLDLDQQDNEGLLSALGVDFRTVWPTWNGRHLHAESPGIQVDPQWGFRTRWVEHGTGGYNDYCEWPLSDADEAAAEAWPLPDADRDFDYSDLPAQCIKLEGFGLGTGGPGTGDLLNGTGGLMGMQRVYTALAGEDPAWEILAKRKLAFDLARTERTLAAAKGRLDFIWTGEDLGSQRGPLCSLGTWRRVLRPWHQSLVDMARAHGAAVMMHSCGSSSAFFDDLAAMGVAAIDTLQPDAFGMEATRIKSRWGDRLAFHGGIGTGGIVANGTSAEARAEAERVLDAYMPGGGYAFSPAHALQDDTPVENVQAIYAAAKNRGTYRNVA